MQKPRPHIPKRTQALWKCLRMVVGTRRVGCGFWNVYQSKKDMPLSVFDPYAGVGPRSKTSPYSRACKGSGFGQYRWRQVDTRCRHCNARVRFQLSSFRGDGRGRPRRVKVSLGAPFLEGGEIIPFNYWTLQQLIDRCNLNNRGEQMERDEIKFVRAKNYRKVK